jgi:predicted RNase H-like nuclease (RuvC/YqgF family)
LFDREHMSYLERSLSTVTSERDKLSSTLESIQTTHSQALADIDQDWTSKMERTTNDLIAAMKTLEAKHTSEMKSKEEDWEAERSSFRRKMTERDDEISSLKEDALRAQSRGDAAGSAVEEKKKLEAEVSRLQELVATESKRADSAEQSLDNLKILERELAGKRASLASAEGEIAALKQQLESAAAGSGGSGLSQDQVNQLMQDIYAALHTMFSPHDSDDETGGAEVSFSSQDVLKRCRRVLKQVNTLRTKINNKW